MKVALLSMDNLDDFVCYDELLIEPLNKLGWEVEVVSWRAKENWNRFDVVIVRSTWDYQDEPERFMEVLESIDAADCRLENALGTIKWNLDKRYLADLERRGIQIVPTKFSDHFDLEILRDAFDTFGCDEIVIKPCISANADDTFRLTREGLVEWSVKLESLFARRPHMVQPFIQSVVQNGEYSLFYFDGKYSHAILKTPKAGDFRVQEEHGGILQRVGPSDELRAAGSRVMSAVSPTPLYARIDFVLERDEPMLMEIELIEPSLYFNLDSDSAERFAHAFDKRMASGLGKRGW